MRVMVVRVEHVLRVAGIDVKPASGTPRPVVCTAVRVPIHDSDRDRGTIIVTEVQLHFDHPLKCQAPDLWRVSGVLSMAAALGLDNNALYKSLVYTENLRF